MKLQRYKRYLKIAQRNCNVYYKYGLFSGAVANNSSCNGTWSSKTPDEILSDVNNLLEQTHFAPVQLSQQLNEDANRLGIEIDYKFDKMLLNAITEDGKKNLKYLLDRFNENMANELDKQNLESDGL